MYSRSRKITSGVRLKPIERSPTPFAYSGSRKKLKKRRDRKRSSTKDHKIDEETKKNITGKSKDRKVQKQNNYEYESDLDFFVDYSSNDEGFASGRPTSLGDSQNTDNTILSQFTPRLETMIEEEEEDEMKYEQSNISLYEEDVQAYLKSEALKDGKVLKQVEQSWNIFLQLYVSRKFIH